MNHRPFAVESLEPRQLLSASIQVLEHTLIIRGTPRNDVIQIRTPSAIDTSESTVLWPAEVTINGRTRQINGLLRVEIEAGRGDDLVESDSQIPSTILGGDGNDTLTGGSRDDLLSGGAGRDHLDGSLGQDTLQGDGNSDEIIGGLGNDLLQGGRGDDRITAQQADQIFGGDGFDLVTEQPGEFSGTRTDLEGTVGAQAGFVPQVEVSPRGTLTIYGTRRADLITLNLNAFVTVIGMPPGPTYSIYINGAVVSAIPAARVKRINIVAGAGDDQVTLGPEIEGGMMIPEFAAITTPVTLSGGDGNDTLTGGWGDDSLLGGAGDDVLVGALGNDTLVGDDGRDTLRGDDGNDSLSGLADADSLDGGAGNDYVDGGTGTDVIFGGAGHDVFSDADTDAERKDRQPDEVLLFHAPLPPIPIRLTAAATAPLG